MWILYRQDDYGNIFVVERFQSEKEANDMREVFEQRAHKQTYFVLPSIREQK